MLPQVALIHVAIPDAWEAAKPDGSYVPAGFEREGFVHCCHPHQLDRVLTDHFASVDEVLLLVLDPTRIASEVRYDEAANGEEYPHIYGPIEAVAVQQEIHTRRIERKWQLP